LGMELPAVEIDGDRLHAGHRDGWPQDHVGPGCRHVREMVLKPALRLQLPRYAPQAYRVAGLAGDDDLSEGSIWRGCMACRSRGRRVSWALCENCHRRCIAPARSRRRCAHAREQGPGRRQQPRSFLRSAVFPRRRGPRATRKPFGKNRRAPVAKPPTCRASRQTKNRTRSLQTRSSNFRIRGAGVPRECVHPSARNRTDLSVTPDSGKA